MLQLSLERRARLVLDDLEDLLELLHLVVLGEDLVRVRVWVRLGDRVSGQGQGWGLVWVWVWVRVRVKVRVRRARRRPSPCPSWP